MSLLMSLSLDGDPGILQVLAAVVLRRTMCQLFHEDLAEDPAALSFVSFEPQSFGVFC
jgi:hypothetical protein